VTVGARLLRDDGRGLGGGLLPVHTAQSGRSAAAAVTCARAQAQAALHWTLPTICRVVTLIRFQTLMVAMARTSAASSVSS
jgi:hypothetical protein